MPVWRTLAVGKYVPIDVEAHCGQVRHIEVPMDLSEAAVFVPKMTALAIWAEFFAIKLPAILRLVLVIDIGLLLLIQIQLVIFTKFFLSVRVLTLVTIATKTSFSPILAHVALIH